MSAEDDIVELTAVERPSVAPIGQPAPPVRQPPQLVGDPVASAGELPQPLDDPMRILGRFLGWGALLQALLLPFVCAGVCGGFVSESSALIGIAAAGFGFLLFMLPYSLAVWRILPKRDVDLVYLRSFRNDRATSSIRFDLHRAIGGALRISGIRDPRRRWPKFLRFAFFFLFALRHVSPRYLNLEAGDDWKRRLWRTLGLARGVVIDVSDLTPHVVTEVRLCLACMNPDRILFVGDDCRTVDGWEYAIRAAAPQIATDSKLNVAIWSPDSAGRESFRQSATAFAAQLPPGPAGHRASLAGIQDLLGAFETEPRRNRIWLELSIGIVLGFLISISSSVLSELFVGWGGYLAALPFAAISVGFLLTTFYYFVGYLWDCGSNGERALSIATFGFVFALPIVFTVGATSAANAAREAADRTIASNNLKQIAMAMHMHDDAYRAFPAANAAADGSPPADGSPAVSWRVKLLPFLLGGDPADDANIQAVIDGYRYDEPWDSAHNLQFVPMIPKVYRPASRRDTCPLGNTRSQVVVSPASSTTHAIFLDGQPGTPFSQIWDGSGDTILIAEADRPVPWTSPEDLTLEESGPLPKLSTIFPNIHLVAYADGAVHSLPATMSEPYLSARLTANGGESVFDP